MMSRIFRDHPGEAGETYFQHQKFAATFGLRLMAAGCAAVIHGLVPCLFTTTAGDMVEQMNATIRNRRAGMHPTSPADGGLVTP